MEIEPHPLYDDTAIVRFFDADEYMVATRALLANKEGAIRLKGLMLRMRPGLDAILGRPQYGNETSHTRDTMFKHVQLNHIENRLVETAEDLSEDELLDASNIVAAIQDYFGTDVIRDRRGQ